MEFWSDIPFGWLFMLLLAFTAGLIVEDFVNDNSWIRKNIRSINQVFVIESFNTPHKTLPHHEYLEIKATIRFVKNVKRANIVLMARSCLNVVHARADFILDKKATQNVVKDETMEFVIGIVPLKAYDGNAQLLESWGSKVRESGDTEGRRSLFGGSDNLVEIVVSHGVARVQKESVFFAIMNEKSGSYGRVFVARDMEPLFVSVTPNRI